MKGRSEKSITSRFSKGRRLRSPRLSGCGAGVSIDCPVNSVWRDCAKQPHQCGSDWEADFAWP
jgi:hypothetical protein